jgi:glucokinase
LGIGIASAGPLDVKKGIIFNNANLGFREIPLREPIQKEYPESPVYIVNDCVGAVLGVHYFEADKDEKDNLVYITISTGVGGGVICNGMLLLGKDGNAAEIGHAILEPKSNIQCNCGAYGCWESICSGTGVIKRAITGIKEGKVDASILLELIDNDTSKITSKIVFEAAKKDDKLAKEIVQKVLYFNKVGVGLVNTYYDCTSIYLGGGMLFGEKEILVPPLIKQFEEDPIKFTINNPPKIKVTSLGDEVGLRGALALVKYKYEKKAVVQANLF